MTGISTSDRDLAEAIPKLARASVLVVGDAMLDRYVFGSLSGAGGEESALVLTVEDEQNLPGGAGNVVRSLTALGVAVAFVSVVGDDQAGSDLTGLIGGQPNIEPWLLVQGGRTTTVTTRFIARGRHLFRSNHEVTGPVHAKLAERMLRIVGDALAATSVTVLSDYGKGLLAGDLPGRVIAAARAAGRPVVVDFKVRDFDRYAGADIAVLQADQLERAAGSAAPSSANVAAAAKSMRARHGFGAVAVSRGSAGASLVTDTLTLHFPPALVPASDAPARQDAMVSVIAAGLAAGLDLELAVRLGNLAMGVAASLSALQTATAADLLAVLAPPTRAPAAIALANSVGGRANASAGRNSEPA